jgi:Bacterial regulatory helix-turn-helix protein, lysR family
VEVRQPRYFVTLADELQFGRVAERLTIARSAVSRQVRRPERELGLSRSTARRASAVDRGGAELPANGARRPRSRLAAAPSGMLGERSACGTRSTGLPAWRI